VGELDLAVGVGEEPGFGALEDSEFPALKTRGVAASHDAVASGFDPGRSDFLPGLAEFLTKNFGVRVAAADWPEGSLPDYLRPRIEVVDATGSTLVTSRDLAAIHDAMRGKSAGSADLFFLIKKSVNQRNQKLIFRVLRRPVIAATSVGSACCVFAGGLFALFTIGGGGSIGIVAIGDDE
jgi:hypothetical protein